MNAARRTLDRNALLVPNLTDMFELLGVSGSVFCDGRWRAIHEHENIVPFEIRYGRDLKRVEYNQRALERARAQKRTVISTHAGFTDLFVPIISGTRYLGLLVTGPIATERPNSASVFERWRWLSGRQAHPSDPEFADYLSVMLSTLVLEDGKLKIFARYLKCVADMMAGAGDAEANFKRAEALRPELERARYVERMWEMVRSMLDERTTRSWPSPQRMVPMQTLGLSRSPDQILVALLPSLRPDSEPVDELLRREALQRACATLALKTGNLVSGKVGEQGVTLLAAFPGSAQRARRRLLDLGDEVIKLARSFGFRVHTGLALVRDSETLSQAFHMAFAAAETALSKGVRSSEARTTPEQLGSPLSELRRELAKDIEERPAGVAARFDRYLELVAVRSGYRLELTRAHVEAGFERIAESLRQRRALEEKSYRDMFESIEQAGRQARSVRELFDAYRRAVADVVEALQKPAAAQRDRSLRRALTYIQQHYSEPLKLGVVARVAGFAPNYFSQLFKRRERMTFERYVRRLRIERAQHLLASTDFSVQRIAELAGFARHSYFTSAFKKDVGVTPLEYRGRSVPQESPWLRKRAAKRD